MAQSRSRSQKRKLARPLKQLFAATAAVGSLLLAQPAHAYYWGWGYMPFGMGLLPNSYGSNYIPFSLGNSLWPMTRILGIPYGYTNPAYYTAVAVRRGFQGGYNRAPGYGANPLSQGGYTYDPSQQSPNAGQQIQLPPNNTSQPPQVTGLAQPNALAGTANSALSASPGGGTINTGGTNSITPAGTAQTIPQRAPQPAPPITKTAFAGNQNFQARNQSDHSLNLGAGLTDGFVAIVNQKFGSDLSLALQDPETRGWARAVGLIDEKQVITPSLSPERNQTIARIMTDPALDSVSKLEAIKILLRGPSAATMVAGNHKH